MERNFSLCPHCARAGKPRTIRPSTVHTPLVSRSDGHTYHLYLEESNVVSFEGRTKETVGLFRYDLDPAGIRAESTLVRVPEDAAGGESRMLLEDAADRLAGVLETGRVPCRVYRLEHGRGLVEASSHFPTSTLSRT